MCQGHKLKTALAVAMLGGAVTTCVLGLHTQPRLRQESRQLEHQVQELARRHSRGRPEQEQTGSSLPVSTEENRELLKLRGQVGVLRREQGELPQLKADNLRLRQGFIEKLVRGQTKLSLEQVASYLQSEQRNAGSLLAAWRVTGEQALLREAIDKYPSDPCVCLAAYLGSGFVGEVSPEARRARLELFMQSSPDNALASYLSANAYFEEHQPDRAMEELTKVPVKAKIQDYWGVSAQNTEDAYLAAGFSAIEAKTLALCGKQSFPWDELMDQLVELRAYLTVRASRSFNAGDQAKVQEALQAGMALAQRISEDPEGHCVGRDLIGVDIESEILACMGHCTSGGNPRQGVKDRLDALAERRQDILALGNEDRLSMLEGMPAPDQLAFFACISSSGELEALRWLKGHKRH